jgi:hypothetical protein
MDPDAIRAYPTLALFGPAQICLLFKHLPDEPPQVAFFETLAEWEKLSVLFADTCAAKKTGRRASRAGS